MYQSVSFENEVTEQFLLLSNVVRISRHAKPNTDEPLGNGLLNFWLCERVVKPLVKFSYKLSHCFFSEFSCMILELVGEVAVVSHEITNRDEPF